MTYLGLRPGEFVESSNHPQSNEGLEYKDVTLKVVPCEDGQVRLVLELSIRNRKNHRDNDADRLVLTP